MTLRIDPALSSVKLASLQKGLVLRMSLDQQSYNPATKRFTDKTPYSNHGTSYNDATFTTDRMGQPNRAMSFNGENDYVNCGNNESLNNISEFTAEAWVKVNDLASIQGIFVLGSGKNNQGFRFRIQTSGNAFLLMAGGGSYDVLNSTDVIAPNEWHHVVVVGKSGSFMRLYVDGHETSKTTSQTMDSPIGNTLIGNSYSSDVFAEFFNGTIDEVRIYNQALSADEITSLYEQYRPKFLI